MEVAMKFLPFVLVILFSLQGSAQEKPQIPREALESSEEGVVNVIGGRAYLRPEKLLFSQNQWFLQNDLQQWSPLGIDVLEDGVGFYLYARAAQCLNGHDGFKKVKGTWYCLEEECYYFYGNHF
jgi:hypothetical protein